MKPMSAAPAAITAGFPDGGGAVQAAKTTTKSPKAQRMSAASTPKARRRSPKGATCSGRRPDRSERRLAEPLPDPLRAFAVLPDADARPARGAGGFLRV